MEPHIEHPSFIIEEIKGTHCKQKLHTITNEHEKRKKMKYLKKIKNY